MSDQLGLSLGVTEPATHLDYGDVDRAVGASASAAAPAAVPVPDPIPPPEPLPPVPKLKTGPERPVDELASEVAHPTISDDIDATAKLFEVVSDPTLMEVSSLDQYVVPPFTVLDTRQGYWQERRRKWLSHGIKSEIGRDDKLTYGKFNQSYLAESTQDKYGGGSTSVFDPVLTELAYLWFCPSGGTVLDPFAGGSVRGIVAASRGLGYIGIELSHAQVAANIEQGHEILAASRLSRPVPMPLWIQGDSDNVLDEDIGAVDLIFTCPPYYDLETYSQAPGDLSNMSVPDFDVVYSRILGKAARWLRDNRFAVVVVSDVRDPKTGAMRDLEGVTRRAMANAGLCLWGTFILLNVAGTAPIRAGKQFAQSRKPVRVHQAVQLYLKGDGRKAAQAIGGGGHE